MISILAVAAGAALGAWLRWALALRLNPLFPTLPPGTLAANLLGGYAVGVALAVLARHPQAGETWRLLGVVGFLGGLTTFSAFSAELAGLLRERRWWAAAALAAAHALGSVGLTLLGLATPVP